eukprot:SAG22_NODE_1238_length_5049_cov_42.930707_3_plen_76_part_00
MVPFRAVPLPQAFLNFAGVADGQSGIFTDMKSGIYQYRLWVLQKTPAGAASTAGGKKAKRGKKAKNRSPSPSPSR